MSVIPQFMSIVYSSASLTSPDINIGCNFILAVPSCMYMGTIADATTSNENIIFHDMAILGEVIQMLRTKLQCGLQ
jgi:hypothetical protein